MEGQEVVVQEIMEVTVEVVVVVQEQMDYHKGWEGQVINIIMLISNHSVIVEGREDQILQVHNLNLRQEVEEVLEV